jgi:hypothetical protein
MPTAVVVVAFSELGWLGTSSSISRASALALGTLVLAGPRGLTAGWSGRRCNAMQRNATFRSPSFLKQRCRRQGPSGEAPQAGTAARCRRL